MSEVGKGKTVEKPEAPQAAPAAAPKAAEVIDASKQKLKTENGAVAAPVADPKSVEAKPEETPAEAPFDNPENLPDNEWSRQYYELKEQMKNDINMQGPMMGFALAALKLAAKYAKYTDMFPRAFANRVNNSDALKDKALSKEQADKLVEAHLNDKGKTEEQTKKELEALKAEGDKEGGNKLGAERASTKFVTNVLWNNDEFNDTATLAAHLLHTSKGGENLYNEIAQQQLDAKSPKGKGTLIVFVPNWKSGEKVMAYSTGVADEFKYYDIESPGNPVQTFKLSAPNSPIKKPDVKVLMILAENVEGYKNAKEEVAAEGIEDKTKKALEKIEKDNAEGARMIQEYPKNKNPDNLAILQTAAASNFAEADKLYQEMDAKSKSDDNLNVEKLTKDEAAAKTKAKATDATDEDKNLYKKIEEANKFKENLAKLKLLRDQAEKNNTEAQKLK